MGSREPPLSLLPLCSLSSSCPLLECCFQNQQKEETAGPFRSSHAVFSSYYWTDKWESGLPTASSCSTWHNTCSWRAPGGSPWLCQVLGTTSDDQVILGLILGRGKAMLAQYLASGSLGAGQGADQGESETRSLLQMQLLQGNGAGSLSWLNVSVTSSYLGGAIITMHLGAAGVIPPQPGLGDMCSKASTFGKSTEFCFGQRLK